MRSPRRLARELGPAGFIVFQLMVGGSVLAPLVHPIFAVVVAADLISGRLWSHDDSVFGTVLCWINLTTLLSGYLGSVLLGYFGLARRGLRRTAWALLLMPFYWGLLSLAAWRALIQLISNPYHWEKTEHGLARTSRQRAFADADAAVVRAVRSRV
jgi:hypothetical protein